MADLKKLADDLTTKAALAAGKDAAERAVEDLLSSDEDKAQQEAERAATSKRRRYKLIAIGVVGLLIVVGLLGMVVSYWQWFLLAGVLGLAGLYGWYRLRKHFRAGKQQDQAADSSAERQASQLRVEQATAEAPADQEEEARLRAARLREERAREALAREEARAIEEQEIDDELAAMKARLKK